MKKSSNRKENKKVGEELQSYLMWRRRGSIVPAKKGKGSYKRTVMKQEDRNG